jgi:hypothetical protein
MSLFDRITEKAFRAVGALIWISVSTRRVRTVVLLAISHNSNCRRIRISVEHRAMRANSRALARDNDYMIGFLKKLEANVIGTDGLEATGRCEEVHRREERGLEP